MKSRRRHGFSNPLPALFWALLLACLVGAGALLAYSFNPHVAGHPLTGAPADTAYRFDRLEFDRGFFRFEIDSGCIVPIMSGDEVRGAYILGLGRFEFVPPEQLSPTLEADIGHTFVQDSFDAIFIPVSYQELEDIKYNSLAYEIADTNAIDRVAMLLEDNLDQVASTAPFGASRLLMTPDTSFFALVHGHRLGTISYTEGNDLILRFLTLGGKEVTLPNPHADPHTPVSALSTPAVLPVSVAVLGANLLILLLVTYILTLDLEHAESSRRLESRKLDLAVFALGLVFMEATFWLVSPQLGLQARELTILYGLFALLIFAFLFRHHLPLSAVGITTAHLGRAVLLGLFLGALTPIAMSLSLPTDLLVTSLDEVLERVGVSVLTIGLLQSFYLYGFLLASLQRLTGGVAGLLITAAIAALIPHLPLLLSWNINQGLYPLQPILIHPIGTLFIGFLFIRTRNMAAVIVLRTMLDVIPRILEF